MSARPFSLESIIRSGPAVPCDRIEVVWNGLIDHSEGLAIDRDGTVWCGGEEGQVYRGSLDATPVTVAQVSGRTLGFAVDAGGVAYCADMTSPGIYRISPTGNVELICVGTPDKPVRVPNHLAFTPDGILLVTDSGTWGHDDGCVFALDPSGGVRVVDDSARAYPNGIAVSPEGRSIAVVESTLPGVSLLALDAGGSVGDRRVLLAMPGAVPDGVAWDIDGRLLVSCWTPDAVFIVDSSGGASLLAHDPIRFTLNQPTNIAFVPGTNRVVAANIGDRFLSVIEHDCAGADVHRPEFAWTGPALERSRP